MADRPDPVPLAGAVYGRAEIDAVLGVLERGGRLRMGQRTLALEERVAALLGKRFGVMVNSGSSALELAVQQLGVPPGSEVVTPPLTFSTDVAALVRAGLVPAFVDVTPGTYCVDLDRVEAAIGPETKAMLVPNLVGNVPDWDRLRALADRHGLRLLEDSCDALGARLRGRPPGERADLSVTSFNESHIITAGGTGGLVACDDAEVDAELRLARNWGRSSSRHGSGPQHFRGDAFAATLGGTPYHADFVFERVGYNLEGCELLAAFGLAQLDRLAEFSALRRRWFAAHAAFFSAHEEHFVLPEQLPEVETAWMCFPLVVRAEAPFSREALHLHLESRGIVSRPIWTGNILHHPGFAELRCRVAPEGYPVADAVLRGGLLVACHHGLDEAQVGRIHAAFAEFLAANA